MKAQLLAAMYLQDGGIDFEVMSPMSKEQMEALTQGCARLMAKVAHEASATPDLACHPGCTFAAMIDLAHKTFHDFNPDEYHRVVKAKMLTQAVTTAKGH